MDPASITRVLDAGNDLSGLTGIRLSGNALESLSFPTDVLRPLLKNVKTLGLERNNFRNLDCLQDISRTFPSLENLSLQANEVSETGHFVRENFPQINALNLADNDISSYTFFNAIPGLFSNLSSLQVTNNPLFLQETLNTPDSARALDKSFYLTLARVPTLQTLNYTKITSRDRQEGELYYLSIAEKELKGLLASNNNAEDLSTQVRDLHPLYPALARKYERQSILDDLTSTDDNGLSANGAHSFLTPTQPTYPAGSLGARLVHATFYLSQPGDRASSDGQPRRQPIRITITLPSSLPVKQVMAIVSRHPTFRPRLQPLQFDLIFESTEFDPVDTTTESTTRSAMYGMTPEQKRNLWQEWGNWDADQLVEQALQRAENGQTSESLTNEEKWTEDGDFQIRDGRKWKRREVDIPHSLKRAWGDWLDDANEVVIRIEPIGGR